MATIKSYTDLEQSRKLAEILPLESADNVIVSFDDRYGVKTVVMPKETLDAIRTQFDDIRETTICWSLAALFKSLPNVGVCAPVLVKSLLENKYYCHYIGIGTYKEVYTTSFYDESIDACVEMIIHLNKLNLL